MGPRTVEAVLADSQSTFEAHAYHASNWYAPKEDLLQEGLIEQWRTLEEGETAALGAWRARKTMNRTAVRQLWTGQETNRGTEKDILRVSDAFVHLEALEYEFLGDYDNVDGFYIHAEVMQVLQELSLRQKEVVYRKFWLEESFPEIASAMGLSRKQAESTWYKQVLPVLRERLSHLIEKAA